MARKLTSRFSLCSSKRPSGAALVAPENAPERRAIPAIEDLQIKLGSLNKQTGFWSILLYGHTLNPITLNPDKEPFGIILLRLCAYGPGLAGSESSGLRV